MRAPDLLQEVVGYRAFSVDPAALELRGKFVTVPWSPGRNEAICAKEHLDWWQPTVEANHVAPHRDCSCGFHAFHDAERLRLHGALLFGAVACWGELVPYAEGFRAQYAEVRALADPIMRGKSIAIAEKYDVPLFPYVSDLRRIDAGAPLPQGLRGA